MISKKIARKTNDSFGRLATYIASANDPGEKLDQFWMVNCEVGDSLDMLDLAVLEIEATQALNTRSKGEKTYHLMISFRDEKPPPEALRNIEAEFAKALGFEEHQRIVATHRNTDNFHIHIAYNQIHPTRLINHVPKMDYRKLEKCCRAMEKKYGLKADLGKEDKTQEQTLSSKARDYEATTWEQSFEGYVKEHKQALMELRGSATSWQDLHNGLASYNLEIRKQGNGLVIKEKDSDRAIKASALDRLYSKAALEKEFGIFKGPEKTKRPVPRQKYKRRPITKYPKQSPSWAKYLTHTKRKESLAIKAYRNWREFLAADALSDSLSLTIIIHHKKLLKGIETLLNLKSEKKLKPMRNTKQQGIR